MVENNKLSKEAKHTLNLSLKVLEHALEIATEKEDLEAIIAISDRLMILYQHLSDRSIKKFKTGFSILDSVDRKDEDDESD